MDGDNKEYQARRVQRYLNDLLKSKEPKKLLKSDMVSFKDDLEKSFRGIDGYILEYSKNYSMLGLYSKWKLSKRSPLLFDYTGIHEEDGLVFLFCKTRINGDANGFRFFHVNKYMETEFSFLDNGAFYVSWKPHERIHNENLYIPLDLIKSLI